jgi:hypothetical protein
MKQIDLILQDVGEFSRWFLSGFSLRRYQLEVAREVVKMVAQKRGGKAAAVFARQSGKDEMLAQVLSYLMFLHQVRGGQVVVALPSLRQATISQRRLLERLQSIKLVSDRVISSGQTVRLGHASTVFMSAAVSSAVRGETASLLLVANEAQDIQPDIWDARFDPMGASTNAPVLFLGTPWTERTLLSREMKEARRQNRLWMVDWKEVAKDVPAYGERVRERLEQYGENHPFIRTEYECRELSGDGGLFPRERQALMRGSHGRRHNREAGETYALLVDVAGSDETRTAADSGDKGRDSTAVTVVLVEESVKPGTRGRVPLYRVVNRYLWHNVPLQEQSERLVTLARETWQARYVVVDSTGLGAGLASSLTAALGRRVIPYTFNARSKSALGWGWLGLIESGRYLEYRPDAAPDTVLFWKQLGAVEFEVLAGPSRTLRWSVPDPLLHDDLVMSAALCAALEEQNWGSRLAKVYETP